MCMRTSQTSQWRSLFDLLKDVIPEARVSFNDKGLKIVAKDQSMKFALIHLEIQAEFYFIKEPVTIGINLAQLYRMLRGLTSSGYFLELTLRTSTPKYLNVAISNADKNIKITHQLQMMDIPGHDMEIQPYISNRVISMPSVELQRYIKELAFINSVIKVCSTKEGIQLSATGSFGTTTIEVGYSAGGMHCVYRDVQQDENMVIEACYPAKFLEKFTKPLDSTVTLYMKQDFPLVIRYTLPSSTIRLVLAKISEEQQSEGV